MHIAEKILAVLVIIVLFAVPSLVIGQRTTKSNEEAAAKKEAAYLAQKIQTLKEIIPVDVAYFEGYINEYSETITGERILITYDEILEILDNNGRYTFNGKYVVVGYSDKVIRIRIN